jgi:FG-GAP-like repeat/Abnormal spindle-like microcephaly-assoc'd, ASPM-SPD-2-Hydin
LWPEMHLPLPPWDDGPIRFGRQGQMSHARKLVVSLPTMSGLLRPAHQGQEVRFGMTRLYPFRFHRVLCAVVALLCLAGINVRAWAQFETRASHPLPPGAFSIATGDFNGDGNLDIAVIDDNGFSVSLGNGDGTFQKAVSYTTQLAYSLAVADFNNDGKLDIVVANENLNPSTVSVYLGNGDGTFQAPIDSPTTNYNEFVAVGDFNGDGKMDIVVVENPYVSVLLGNGDGTFQAPSDNNSFIGAQNVAVGDFNNDHKLDVVVVGFFGGSQNIGVLLGNGDGTLQNSLTYPLTYTPQTVATGDFNVDGNLDVVISDKFNGVTVLLGNGQGGFGPQVTYDTTSASGGPVMVDDLNLDGKLDLAVACAISAHAGGVDVFWGNGDGTFQPAQYFASGLTGLPAVGDLNGDHLPDLVLANELSAVTMLSTGVVSFSPTAPLVFPVRLINTSSSPESVTLTNTGAASLSISSIKASGQFQINNTCGSSVAAGGSCAIAAVFRPRSEGTHTGLIELVDSASSKPQFIELSGQATVVKLSATSLNYGSQKVGTKSPPQVLTATNEGSVALTFSLVSITGKNAKDFSQTNNCLSGQIPPGGKCAVTVTFSPTKTGARTGTLYIDVQGGVSPRPVVLTGTGT